MEKCQTYVRIDGEPFLSRAKVYRDLRTAWRKAWSDFAKSKGATGHSSTGRDLAFGSCLPPDGWTRPGKYDFSHPKKGHPDCTEMERMRTKHPKPSSRDVYGDAVCLDLSYERGESRGSYGIGDFGLIINGPWVGWAGDVFFGLIPDAEAAVRYYAQSEPDLRIVGPAATWKLSKGLTRLTEAEYELIIAQHKVDEERSALDQSEAAA